MANYKEWVALSFKRFVRGEEGSEKGVVFALPFSTPFTDTVIFSQENVQLFSTAKANVGVAVDSRQIEQGPYVDVPCRNLAGIPEGRMDGGTRTCMYPAAHGLCEAPKLKPWRCSSKQT